MEKSKIMLKNSSSAALYSLLIGFISLAGCGGVQDVPVLPANYQAMLNPVQSCCCTCQTSSSTKTTKKKTTSSSAKTTPTTDKTTTTTPKDTGSAAKDQPKTDTKKDTATSTDTSDPKVKGRKILDKLMGTINAANAFEVLVDKSEKNLKTGDVLVSGIHLWAIKPDQVKLELTAHSKNPGSVGTKLTYTSNSGKVRVRPTGVLSLVTTELDMSDDRIISPNGYEPDKTDIFGMVKRLSQPNYEAELTGKTSIDGNELYLLKITPKGNNDLDPKIKYEQLGFDPKTFVVKLWETYDGTGSDPFMRYYMKTFNLLDSIPDSTMKI